MALPISCCLRIKLIAALDHGFRPLSIGKWPTDGVFPLKPALRLLVKWVRDLKPGGVIIDDKGINMTVIRMMPAVIIPWVYLRSP